MMHTPPGNPETDKKDSGQVSAARLRDVLSEVRELRRRVLLDLDTVERSLVLMLGEGRRPAEKVFEFSSPFGERTIHHGKPKR